MRRMEPAVMLLVVCLMAEQITVCPGVVEPFVAVIRTLSNRKGNGTVGELCADRGDDIAEPFIGKPSVFAALKDKCPESEAVSFLAAGEDIFFGEAIAQGVCIALADAAVIAVVAAVVRELDKSPDIDVMSVMMNADCPRQLKEMFSGGRSAFPYDRDPFAALKLPRQAGLVDQRGYFLFSVIGRHMFFP